MLAPRERRQILDELADRERGVGELVQSLNVAQPQVSKHLHALRLAGVVSCRADGRRRLYRVNRERFAQALDWLAKFEVARDQRFDRVDAYLHELQKPGGHS